MTRTIVGVFGRDAGTLEGEVEFSLDPDVSGRLTTASLAMAWSGSMPARDARTVVVAGRLQNRRALSAELGVDDDRSSDHVLSLAYDRWGEEMLTRLRGGFVIVIWDPSASLGLLAVDQLGVGGLFLHESAGRLFFATELRNLVRLLPRRPAPAASSLVQWLADGYLGVGETLLEGVRRLEGGHVVILEGGHLRTTCYWSPEYRSPDRLTRADAIGELEVALAIAVRQRMAEEGTTGVLLSGGLDSSTVAAIARGLGPTRGPIKAFSNAYPEHPEVDESRLAELVARTLEVPWEAMHAPNVGTLSSALEFQLAWEVPAATPMLSFTQPVLRRAAAEGVTVMLDGEGGDELFGCSPYLIADLVRKGRLREAVALVKRLPSVGSSRSWRDLWADALELGLKGSAPHAVHRTMRRLRGHGGYAAPWLTRRSATLYVDVRDHWEWKRRSGPRWWAFLAYVLTSWREQMGAYDFLRRRDALAGLETRHPMLDDADLIERVLRLPPQLSFDPEFTRPLARAMVAGVLPDEIVLRRDKSSFGQLVVDALNGSDYSLASELLEAADAEIWAYAQPSAIQELLHLPAQRRNLFWARLLWRLATTEIWLRAQTDPDFPTRLLERHASSISDGRPASRVPRRASTS